MWSKHSAAGLLVVAVACLALTVSAQTQEGGSCSSDYDCSSSLVCIPDNTGGNKACANPNAVGGSCGTDSHCAYTKSDSGMTYCNIPGGSSAGTCASSKSAGGTCSESSSSQSGRGEGYSRQCKPISAYCDSDAGSCKATKADGASCDKAFECKGYCNSDKKCAAWKANGVTCDSTATPDGCGGNGPPFDSGYCQKQDDDTHKCHSWGQIASDIVTGISSLVSIIIGVSVAVVVLCIILPIVICCCCAAGAGAAGAAAARSNQPPPVVYQQQAVGTAVAPAPAPGPVTLPPGWIVQTDPATGRQYYGNPTTKQTSWTVPTA